MMDIDKVRKDLKQNGFEVGDYFSLSDTIKKQFPKLANLDAHRYMFARYEYQAVKGLYIVIIATRGNEAYMASIDTYNNVKNDVDEPMNLRKLKDITTCITDIIMESEMDAEI